jgi:pimeloyl-ACP methyl ester carboxylesterase
VILLHGVGLDRTMWQAQAHLLASVRRVVTYDLLGHGESPRAGAATTLDDYVAQLARLLDFLRAQRAAVLGFSFGGLIAQAFALAQPARVEKLVLMSTVHERSPTQRQGVEGRLDKARSAGPQAIIEAAVGRWFSPPFIAGQPEVIGEIERRLRGNDPESFLAAYALFAKSDQGLADRIAGIAAPTLVVTGELDTGSTPDMARRMADAIPGAELEIIPEARHMMPVELPGEVGRSLRRFLG